MNGEQALAKIRSTIQQKIAETPAVQKLIDKINSGKATYADTALYARWAAINLGMCLSGVICDIDLNDRAAVCKALMLDQYRDINGFVDIVQSELDSRFGIQLAPQRAPFNKERADTIGHSLADTTKPDEVIERRAENAVANAVESMHDDRMQAESKFRSRLGLTVVIERTGANCCPWCAEVAGKYRYGDEPEGVFRRHDNCNCTIIYDSQVLRGALDENGKRTKTWEEVNPEKVRGFEPDVNTPEQAKALEETALQGLTMPGQGDIMESELGKFRIRLQSEAGMNDTYYSMIKERFSHGSDAAKKAFNKFVPADSVADYEYTSVPHYDPESKRIYMNYEADMQNPRGNGATWFHEHGHLIDEAAGNLSSDAAFYEALRKDKSQYTASIIRSHGTRSAAETYSILQDELSDFRSQSGVADMFNGLSAGVIRGCATHPDSYWTRESVCQEAFAHMYEAQFDRVRYEQMKHYFPTALARFEQLLGGTVK